MKLEKLPFTLTPSVEHVVADRIAKKLKPSTFETINMMAAKTKAVNMAQGFPDWPTPKFCKEFLHEATLAEENQYLRVAGHLSFVEAISEEYSEKFGRKVDPLKEVFTANGATGVLMDAFAGFINPGDELIVFEPVFEFYYQQNELFGGVTRYFAMNPPTKDNNEWTINFTELRKIFNEKTRMIILNTPHNPTGKMLTEEEIKEFVEILKDFPRVIVLADEVYEYMTYDGRKHLRIANYPGMWERTLSIYSSGKTFSCTGWRIGYGIGDERLIKPLIAAQNWSTFCVNRPAQVAIARAMKHSLLEYEGSKSYYEYLGKLFQRKKDDLLDILRKAPFGWRVIEPDGGYFAIVDISEVAHKIPVRYFYDVETNTDETPIGDGYESLKDPLFSKDFAFCQWLMIEYKVAPIPLSPFYNNSNCKRPQEYRGQNFLRFAICKKDETTNAVRENLTKTKL